MTSGITTVKIEYPVAAKDFEAKRAEYAAITCDTPAGYESCRVAIAHCRTARVAIEERRVELKRDSLEYGRRVDAVAKELTALIEGIEEPLKEKRLAVDNERERKAREAEEAKRLELEAKLRAEREAEEARLRAEREAEEARLAVERERLAEEQKRMDAEREAIAATQRAEAKRLADERAALEAEQRKAEEAARKEREAIAAERAAAERVEFERQAAIRAEAEAKARAERERIEAEEARVAEAERQAKAQARLDALRPDVEKLAAFAAALAAVKAPTVKSREATAHLALCVGSLEEVIASLRGFKP